MGWTDYTRGGTPAPTGDQQQTQQLSPPATTALDPEPTAQQPDQLRTGVWDAEPADTAVEGPGQPEAPEQPEEPGQAAVAANPWAQQPADPWAQPPSAWGQQSLAYAPYQPPPKAPLTGSGMRPLNGMFADIGRIVRRGWLPILGISLAIWAAVSIIYVVALSATVDLDALQRGFDLLGAATETSPETGLPVSDPEISAAFRDAFAALSPSGWALLITALTVLLLVASSIQTAAVNRVGMDAAAGVPVTWGAGWRAGFTAGLRLFGYYVLLSLVIGLAWTAATVLVVVLWGVSPAIGVIVGLLGFLALIVLSVWLTGRLIPVIVQVVMGRRAISWSWRHTHGKFWAVLGRYLLWSLAAGVIVNILVTILSIPASLLFLGTAASSSSSAQLGASLVITLLTLPLSMALSAVTFIGVVPVWRDLTDDPQYRAIGEDGLPVPVG